MNENTKYKALLAQLNDIEAELEDTKAYANEIYAKKSSLEMQATTIRHAIRAEMEADGVLSHIIDGYKLALRKKQDKLTYTEEFVPEQFKVTKTVTEIDKALLKDFATKHPQEAQAFAKVERGGYDLVVQMTEQAMRNNQQEADRS